MLCSLPVYISRSIFKSPINIIVFSLVGIRGSFLDSEQRQVSYNSVPQILIGKVIDYFFCSLVSSAKSIYWYIYISVYFSSSNSSFFTHK